MSSDLAPGLLIAAPTMKDPNFAHSVVLMAEHGPEGAVGFIMNKPTPITLGRFLGGVDEDLVYLAEENGCSHELVMLGGPVQNHVAWVLYIRQEDDEELDEGSFAVGEELVVGASMETLRAFVGGKRKGPFKVMLGYAGWGEEQLEEEIGEGSWLPMDLDDELAFSEEAGMDFWETAMKGLGLVPGQFMMGGPGASA